MRRESKTNELVVKYQRNKRSPVLFGIQGGDVKKEDSCLCEILW